mmetsp:Transcript_52499/g.139791  ORF Transcript_52499/g.139791 Transcript_52499/m.139791 type:complete len:156 (-) Transcript_52499:196-663(-)
MDSFLCLPEWTCCQNRHLRSNVASSPHHAREVEDIDSFTSGPAAIIEQEHLPTKACIFDTGPEYTVAIHKSHVGEPLGMTLATSVLDFRLSVRKVETAGLLHNWNTTNPDCVVRSEDKLMEVNGVRGPTSDALMHKLKQDLVLKLVFTRHEGAST